VRAAIPQTVVTDGGNSTSGTKLEGKGHVFDETKSQGSGEGRRKRLSGRSETGLQTKGRLWGDKNPPELPLESAARESREQLRRRAVTED